MEGGLRDDHPCMNPDLCPRVKGDDERNGKCETLVREYCSAENSDCTPVGCSAAMKMFNDLNHLEHAKSLATGKSNSEDAWGATLIYHRYLNLPNSSPTQVVYN